MFDFYVNWLNAKHKWKITKLVNFYVKIVYSAIRRAADFRLIHQFLFLKNDRVNPLPMFHTKLATLSLWVVWRILTKRRVEDSERIEYCYGRLASFNNPPQCYNYIYVQWIPMRGDTARSWPTLHYVYESPCREVSRFWPGLRFWIAQLGSLEIVQDFTI